MKVKDNNTYSSINREALYEQIRLMAHRSSLGETTVPDISAKEILSIIADMPVVDAVEVVRCKNCKFRKSRQDAEHGRTEHYCTKNDIFVTRDFFCSYGERKG